MANADPDITPIGEFADQLIRQLLADLRGTLSHPDATPADDAFELIAEAASRGEPRGATLVVLLQASVNAHGRLVQGDGSVDAIAAAGDVGTELAQLVPQAPSKLDALARHATRLVRYAGETEPAAPALPRAIAESIHQLYQGLASGDHQLSSIGLMALKTLVVHVDAMASQLDPSDTGDRPVRVFAPDRFHDYFMKLTELVQKAGPAGNDRAVAALTRDGKLTAVITESDHPLETSAQAIRDLVPGDAATKEHALFRMQGLLRCIDELRADPHHPWADALRDEPKYLSLVTAAATAPMSVPGRFGWAPLAQVARHNLSLLQSPPGGASRRH